MIYAARIGEIQVLLDDELEERPTPECAAEYARRAGYECFDLWQAVAAETLRIQGSVE